MKLNVIIDNGAKRNTLRAFPPGGYRAVGMVAPHHI